MVLILTWFKVEILTVLKHMQRSSLWSTEKKKKTCSAAYVDKTLNPEGYVSRTESFTLWTRYDYQRMDNDLTQ